MCGITGALSTEKKGSDIQTLMQKMTEAVRHRGPDDGGIEYVEHEQGIVAFGHRRLAIIDLSPAGHQPMYDADTGNAITFNGEIYNYRELRRELEQLGQRFRTQTDTEVILKAYAAWGTQCVSRLRGIFAFGLWDHLSRTLFVARDQLGVKPLYYWHEAKMLLFASEVRALLASELISRQLDYQGLYSFLTYGSLQEPYTMVQGIRSLLPGHTLTWQAGQMSIQRYWQLPTAEHILPQLPKELNEQLKERLAEAVRIQMIADVPLGAFLSGGIDSTAIAALMQKAANGQVKTFSIVFEEKKYDERDYSQLAARYIGTEHTELLLRGDEVRQHLSKALLAFDQPSLDGLNTYFVSKVTREANLTVALSGVGGDELFGGYGGYEKSQKVEKWGNRINFIPSALRPPLSEMLWRLSLGESGRKMAHLLQSTLIPYFTSRVLFNSFQISALLPPTAIAAAQGWEIGSFAQMEKESLSYDTINRISALETQSYMTSTLLRDTDQMSMAHALEVRVPLLDHVLVEYLFTLPGISKLERGQPKPLLTRPLNHLLPKECVHRPKRGFELPFAEWFRASLQEEMRNTFLNASASSKDPFSPTALATLWKQFEAGKVTWSRVWALYVLLNWLAYHKIA